MQKSIPCTLMRSGTSRGPFFLKNWLPEKTEERDALLLKVMGTSHPLQINGLGGGSTLTNKVAIVSKSTQPDCDVDYLFAQITVDSNTVDTRTNCGNMLAGVGPFAIEQGLVNAKNTETKVRVYNINTKSKTDLVVSTPDEKVIYTGDVLIDGVSDCAAPIYLNFKTMLGGITGKLFPTGQRKEKILGVDVTCIDAAQLMVLMDSHQLNLRGDEMPDELHADKALLEKIHAIRHEAAARMGLGDITDSVLPKPVLIGRTDAWNIVNSRYFTPKVCHAAHAATGAVGIAISTLMPGTLCHQDGIKIENKNHIYIAHPSGKIEVCVDYDHSLNDLECITNASMIRTARKIFEGHVFLD
ncbi:MAG: 4-oxalomesaconate tautomerase [Comamonas sp.]|jgi:2-methylaconitate cis-trans-isomerase PrpF|nr:4-oxalomesaconate tautomerase [Comamonas sp.]